MRLKARTIDTFNGLITVTWVNYNSNRQRYQFHLNYLCFVGCYYPVVMWNVVLPCTLSKKIRQICIFRFDFRRPTFFGIDTIRLSKCILSGVFLGKRDNQPRDETKSAQNIIISVDGKRKTKRSRKSNFWTLRFLSHILLVYARIHSPN